MCEMHLLSAFEVGEQPLRIRRVVPVPLQLSNQLALTGDEALTEGDVFLGLSKMLFYHCSVHTGW